MACKSMNYYNEFDKNAAIWLRALIAEKLIPNGIVDERSIIDIKPNELAGFTQCHFFAGIGGWPLALSLVGWPESKPIWTGSCPCQPFSTGSANRIGRDDPRHLWPVFAKLIRELHPDYIAGEQVDDAIREGWLDEVFADLEMEGYACGAAVLPARAYGAEHWRDRLFWLADSGGKGLEGFEAFGGGFRGFGGKALAELGDPLACARGILAGDCSALPALDGLPADVVRCVIKGAGNAIVPEVAAEFLTAFIETKNEQYA